MKNQFVRMRGNIANKKLIINDLMSETNLQKIGKKRDSRKIAMYSKITGSKALLGRSQLNY